MTILVTLTVLVDTRVQTKGVLTDRKHDNAPTVTDEGIPICRYDPLDKALVLLILKV